MPKSLLFIGFFDSPHFARWIENVLESTDYELTIFCSSPARRINPYLQRLISENESRLRISKHSPKNPFFAYLLDKIPLVNQRSKALKNEIENRHDIIHYFEMQHSGYLLLPLISELSSERVVYSNYGSDIFWFRKYKSHRRKMEKVLSVTNLVFYECERDLDFLREYCPDNSEYVWTINSGGLRLKPSLKNQDSRDTILVKGYSNRWGRGIKSLVLLLREKKELKDRRLKLVVYSANLFVILFSWAVSRLLRVEIHAYGKGRLGQDEVMELMEKSAIHLAISKSDGIPSSTLEAIASGAIAIQSSSACMDQIIKQGENGYAVSPDSRNIKKILALALSVDNFSHSSIGIRRASVEEAFSSKKIGETMAKSYKDFMQKS